MKCPFCGHTEDRVVDSRVGREGEFIRRRRECLKCHRRYTTYEYIEDVLPHVVKRDGRREPFDRQKLRASILKSCEKRSVGVQADRKSTRLNSSHLVISYAVFCLKKKKKKI